MSHAVPGSLVALKAPWHTSVSTVLGQCGEVLEMPTLVNPHFSP